MLLADAGLGKTRLAQEFYNWLSTSHDGVRGAGYWPDELDQEGNNLRVNPELEDCNNTALMPYLWWGIRLADPEGQNQITTASLVAALSDLRPHLEPMYRARRTKERGLHGTKSAGTAAVDVALELASIVPFGGVVKAVGTFSFEVFKLGRGQLSDKADVSIGDIGKRHRASLTESLIADFTKLFGEDDHRRVPAIIFIDDGQFSNGDPGFMHALEALVDSAFAERWPLMFLVTHWEAEWHVNVECTGTRSLARSIVERKDKLGADWAPTVVEKVASLSPMLTMALPGLTADQHGALLSRADGNPRYLEQILSYAREERNFFIERDPRNELTVNGLNELVGEAMTLNDIIRKRFVKNPEPVQKALSLASLQGTVFLRAIVEEMGLNLGSPELGIGVDQAEAPYAYIRGARAPVACFAQGIYREVSLKRIDALFDRDAALNSLREIIRARMSDWSGLFNLSSEEGGLTRRLALSVLGSAENVDDRRITSASFSAEMHFLLDAGDTWGAAEAAERFIEISITLPDCEVDVAELAHAAYVAQEASRHRISIKGTTKMVDSLEKRKAERGSEWNSANEDWLALAYENRGFLLAKIADNVSAIADHGRAIAIRLDQKSRSGNDWPQGSELALAHNYNGRGQAWSGLGDSNSALQDYEQAICLLDLRSFGSPNDLEKQWLENLATSICNRAGIHAENRHWSAALEDFDRSIELREKLKKFTDNGAGPGADNGRAASENSLDHALSDELISRASARDSTGNVSGSLEDYARAIDLLEALKQRLGGGWKPEHENSLSNGYSNYAGTRLKAGDVTGAIETYDRTIGLREALKSRLGPNWTAQYENWLTIGYSNRGYAHQQLGEWLQSADDNNVVITLLEALRKRLGANWTAEYEAALARGYGNRAQGRAMLSDHEGAFRDFDQALKMMTALKSRTGLSWIPDQEEDLARLYNWRAILHAKLGNFTQSLRDHNLGIDSLKAIRDKPGVNWLPSNDVALAKGLIGRGTLKAEIGNNEFYQDFDQAISLFIAAKSDLGPNWLPRYQMSLSGAYSGYATQVEKVGDPEGALDKIQLSVLQLEEAKMQRGNAWSLQHEMQLVEAYANRASILARLGRQSSAAEDYEQAVVSLEVLKEKVGSNWTAEYESCLAAAYSNRGLQHWNSGRYKEAARDHSLSISLREQLKKLLGLSWTQEFEQKLATSYSNRALVQIVCNQRKEAVEDLDRAIALGESTKERRGADWTPKLDSDLANTYMIRGLALMKLKDSKGALEDFNRAILSQEMQRTSMSGTWTPHYENRLANSHNNRGLAKRAIAKLHEAKYDFDRAIEIREKLKLAMHANWVPEYEFWLANGYGNRADIRRRLADRSGAIEDYKYAIELRLRLRGALGEDWTRDHQRALMESYAKRSHIHLRSMRLRLFWKDFRAMMNLIDGH